MRAADEQLGATNDHGQGVVQFVTRASGELSQSLELGVTSPYLIVIRLPPNSIHDNLETVLQNVPLRD
jgi:hypothetical protein